MSRKRRKEIEERLGAIVVSIKVQSDKIVGLDAAKKQAQDAILRYVAEQAPLISERNELIQKGKRNK